VLRNFFAAVNGFELFGIFLFILQFTIDEGNDEDEILLLVRQNNVKL